MKSTLSVAAILLLTLTGCESGPFRVVHDPKLVEPADPASLTFDHIDHATETAVAVTVIDLRRVEGGVHVVLAVEIPSSFEHPTHPRLLSDKIRDLAYRLDDLSPKAMEILNADGDSISLRPREREEMNRPLDMFISWGHGLRSVPGRERLYFIETRYRTRETLPEGTYRVRAIPSEFPKTTGVPTNVNADQKTFTPTFVPPLPGQD